MKSHTHTSSKGGRVILITGASGYVGAMLIDRLSAHPEVKEIIALDKEPASDLTGDSKKVTWIQANTSDAAIWQPIAAAKQPDTVVHCAWQIREMYGQKELQWKWNITGSRAVFDFAFATSSVKRLIHFSTVASYGAYPDNTLNHYFTEEESFRITDYLYAEEKRIAEEELQRAYLKAHEKGGVLPQVSVVRPAAITGPRGRYGRVRFGLQAALSGQLKESFIHRVISAMVSFVPATARWARQFVHEDDVCSILECLIFNSYAYTYEEFNLCPPGAPVLSGDMADAVHKKIVPVRPWMVRLAFFVMWHISRGKVPTSRGGWKSYSYPILVDGSKVTRLLGHSYLFTSKDAFVKKEGTYAKRYCS
jgi:nucleoside-diphosphate-sugar epimerase